MTLQFFPYDRLRKGQTEAIKFIINVFEENCIGFLHAPTGIGKTVAALSAFLTYSYPDFEEKLIVLTRTKNQAYMYVKEIEKIKKVNNVDVKYTVFRSKKDMCLIAKRSQKLKRAPYHIFLRVCDVLKRERRCPFYERSFRDGVPTRLIESVVEELKSKEASFINIVKLSEMKGVCPYEVARLLAAQSNIVIGSYSYIFKPDIREKFLPTVGESLSTLNLIIDEAHNLPDFIRDALSLTITTNTIDQAIDELNELIIPEKDYVKEFLRDLRSRLVALGERMIDRSDDRPKRINSEDVLAGIAKGDIDLLKETGELFLKKTGEIFSRLIWISEFLEYALIFKDMEEFITIIERKRLENIGEVYYLTFHLLDPSFEAFEIFKEIKSAVLMSGSLYPLEYYETILGLKKNEKTRNRLMELILPTPFPEAIFRVIVDKVCTTKFSERSEKMYNLIAKRIETISEAAPKNKAILIVFPSYELLKIIGFRTKIKARELIVETQETDIENVMKQLRYERNVVIYSVAGGKLMEGIDYRIDNETILSTVVLVGLPFPEWNDITLAQSEYFSKKFGRELGTFLSITVPAIRKSLQAAGRLIRDEKDKGVVIILDRRFVDFRYFRYFPPQWRNFAVFYNLTGLKNLITSFLSE